MTFNVSILRTNIEDNTHKKCQNRGAKVEYLRIIDGGLCLSSQHAGFTHKSERINVGPQTQEENAVHNNPTATQYKNTRSDSVERQNNTSWQH